MKHLDLFSGIGGFSLAAQWVWGPEHNIVAFCEQDKFCQKILNKHWPDVPIYDDIFKLNGQQIKTKDIHLLTGGFPCQPFSVAGKQEGKGDDRYLWPEMFRVIQETKPTWIIGENVPGIIKMGLDDMLSDLESEQYTCLTFVIPACAIDAKHRRDRVWIVANSISRGRGASENRKIHKGGFSNTPINTSCTSKIMADTIRGKLQRSSKEPFHGQQALSGKFGRSGKDVGTIWPIEPDVGRMAHGVSNRVDRLKGLGNAIVPQVAYEILRYIKEIDTKQIT